MGFDSAFLRFFASYLTDRQQRIVISWGKIGLSANHQRWASRVNFYSVSFLRLYKWLELIVNDCYLYSDETKTISTVDNKMQMEKDIEKAIVWGMENWLNFNFDKFWSNTQFWSNM